MISQKIVRSNTSQNQLPRKHTKRPWFNAECQRLRSQYRRSKNHKRRVNNVFLQDASKAYKNVLINISLITRKTLLKSCVL